LFIEAELGKIGARLFLKKIKIKTTTTITTKKTGGMTQVALCLPSNHEALSPILSTREGRRGGG
jgi:hypothetical protein